MIQNSQENEPFPEERLRREAAERLNAMMARSMRLLDDCAMLAATGKTDAAGAVAAAARLLRSNADVAGALLRTVQGETRHRSIVERINGGSPGLNSNFSAIPLSQHTDLRGMAWELEYQLNRRTTPDNRAFVRTNPNDYEDHPDFEPCDDDSCEH